MYCKIKGGEGRGNYRGREKIGSVKGKQKYGKDQL
jgi:hypothetical protein